MNHQLNAALPGCDQKNELVCTANPTEISLKGCWSVYILKANDKRACFGDPHRDTEGTTIFLSWQLSSKTSQEPVSSKKTKTKKKHNNTQKKQPCSKDYPKVS